MEKKEATVNKTKVKEMGFTDKMIAELLPEPEEKPNPYYSTAASQKIWKLEDVERAMETKRYSEMREQHEKRGPAALKAVETKRAKTKELFDGLIDEIEVEVVPIKKLRKEAIRDRRRWYDLHGYDYDDPANAPERVIERWMVNHIRHWYTNYDADLYQGKGEVGIAEEYQRYRREVLNKIGEAYPQLAYECDMQANLSVGERQMLERDGMRQIGGLAAEKTTGNVDVPK